MVGPLIVFILFTSCRSEQEKRGLIIISKSSNLSYLSFLAQRAERTPVDCAAVFNDGSLRRKVKKKWYRKQ